MSRRARYRLCLWFALCLAPLASAGVLAGDTAVDLIPKSDASQAIMVEPNRVYEAPGGLRFLLRSKSAGEKSGELYGSPFRCATNCPGGQSLEPPIQQATTTDEGLGADLDLDGTTQNIIYRFQDPNGNSRHLNAFQLGTSECGADWYYLPVLFVGYYCFPPGWLTIWNYYPHGTEGRWHWRLEGDGALVKEVPFDMVPATIHKLAGDGQTGVINEPATNPLEVQLLNNDGEPVNYPINERVRAFTFSISGPGGSSGAAVSAIGSAHPTSNGTVQLKVTFGNKKGTYKVKVEHPDAAAPGVEFALEALERDEPEDDEENEEDVGDEDPCEEKVGNPISLKIGNKVQREVDYARTGLSPLEFVRTYNSFGSVSRITGNWWSTTFDRFLMLDTLALNVVRVRRPDGLTMNFWNDAGTWKTRRDFQAQLEQTPQGWLYTDAEGTSEVFDAQGVLLSITDLQGRVLTMQYDRRSGKLAKVGANTGESLSFLYDGFGQLSKLTDHTSRVWTYTYSGFANLAQMKRPDGVFHTYLYQQAGQPRRLTGMTVGTVGNVSFDERVATWQYDAQGRAIASFAGYGQGLNRVEVEYHDDGTRTVTGSRGQQSTYVGETVNGRWYLRRIDGPAMSSCSVADLEREYNAAGNITAEVRHGTRTEMSDFDAFDQPRLRIEAAGSDAERTIEYEYDTRFIGRPTLISEPSVAQGLQKVTSIEYDERGNATSIRVNGFRPDGTPVERLQTFAFAGPFGQVSLMDGPRVDGVGPMNFEYDSGTGRLRKVTDANGIVLRDEIQYTATGQIASELRPNGLRVTYAYEPGSDLLSSVVETQQGQSRTTSWTYTPRGLVQSLRHSGAGSEYALEFTYSHAGKLLSVQSPDGARIEYTLDAAGNVEQERSLQGNQLRRWLQRSFDAYDHVEQLVQEGSVQSWLNRSNGTPKRLTDGRSQDTEYEYDDLLRLTRTLQPNQTETQFAYDATGVLSRVIDPNGGTTEYIRDDLGNELSLISPDSGRTDRIFNDQGQVTSSTDAKGQVTSYQYDAGGRLTMIDREGADYDETYSYDSCLNGTGLLCSVANGLGEFAQYTYDGFARVAQVQTPAGAYGYTYDATGQVIELSYPSGRVVSYRRNATGQVLEVRLIDGQHATVLAADVQHQPFGPVRGWIFGNGIVHSRQHDQQFRLQSMSHGGALQIDYSAFDGNGNLLGMQIDGRTQAFSYDPLDRLQSGDGDFGLRWYDYNAVGNRLRLESESADINYTYAGSTNRLLDETGYTYERDANGNRTAKLSQDGVSGLRYDYSPHNRLTGLRSRSGETLASYRYNGLGQRVAKTTAAGTTRFLHDQQGWLLAEVDAAGAVTREYVYLDGIPLAVLPARQALPPPPNFSQVVDNGPPTGEWTSRNDNAAVNRSYLRTSASNGSIYDWHVWSFTLPVEGDYRFEVMWMRPNNQTTGCTPYGIAGTTLCVSNAAGTKGSWVEIGTYRLGAGTQGLSISERTDGFAFGLYADAARATLVSAATDDEPSSVTYLHTDHLDAPRAASDASGAVLWRATYDPFGWATVEADVDGDGASFELNLRFPGQHLDVESGLHYNYFRDYDPVVGRYIQSDPIGLLGGADTFTYAKANPTRGIDPLGLETCVVTLSNGAFHDHAALYISRGGDGGVPLLYDPAGDYARSNGEDRNDIIQGDGASLERFGKHHGNSTVHKTCKDTSPQEERRLGDLIFDRPRAGISTCAINVSHVLNGSQYFPHVQPGTFWPINLLRDARRP